MVALLDGSPRSDDIDPESMSDTELAAELVELRREIDRREARFARLAWVGHQRGIGAADGSPSTQAWLRRHTGMREGDARTAITAGEVTALLPSIGMAWRDGRITATAARTIATARVEEHDLELRALEALLLQLAEAGDQRELRRACAHFRQCAKADGTEPRHHDGLTLSQTYAGTTILNGELSSTGAEIVATALHELTDPPSDDDPRTGRYPGCDRPHGWTQAHHVIYWRHGGPTTLINIISLCDYHHHVLHQTGWTAKFDGHTFTVFRPDGTQVT